MQSVILTKDDKTRNQQLADMVEMIEKRTPFNTGWLTEDESVSYTTSALMISSFEKLRGKFAISSKRVYFQPNFCFGGEPHILKLSPSSVLALVKTEYLNGSKAFVMHLHNESSALFIFDKEEERDATFEKISYGQNSMIDINESVKRDQEQWVTGYLSTFEYIQNLNRYAGRTLNDVYLYPIFPWIFADLKSEKLDLENPATFRDLSKHIGCINSAARKKLERPVCDNFCMTYENILSYLVRCYPDIMFHFNDGKFIDTNKLFMSLEKCWEGIVSGSDPKETIPDLYSGEGLVLINFKSLPLGGTGDVSLPPWAESAKDFIQKARDALECEHVSQNLHKWIDIMFGINQNTSELGQVYPEAVFSPGRGTDVKGIAPTKLFNSAHKARITKLKRACEKVKKEDDIVIEELKLKLHNAQEHITIIENTKKELMDKAGTTDQLKVEVLKLTESNIDLKQSFEKAENDNTVFREENEQLKLQIEKLSKELDEARKAQVVVSSTIMSTTQGSAAGSVAGGSASKVESGSSSSVPPSSTGKSSGNTIIQTVVRKEDIKFTNKYILQLENDLRQSRKDEQARVSELEQTHQVLLKYMNKYKDAKERSDKYWKKICELKTLQQEIHDLKVLLQQFEAEDAAKEKLITQLRDANRKQEEAIKLLKIEVRQNSNSLNTMGMALSKGIVSDALNLSMEDIVGEDMGEDDAFVEQPLEEDLSFQADL